MRCDRQARETPGGRRHDDRSARAAAAAGVADAALAVRAVGRDRSRAADASRAHEHEPAARTAARGNGRVVVAGPRAAPAAQDHQGGAGREGKPSESAAREVRGPGISALTADAAVSASAAARISIVRARAAVGSAATGVPGSAARHAAVGIALDQGRDDGARRGIEDPHRRACDALSLSAVVVLRRNGAIVVIAASAVAVQEASSGPAESGAVHAHGRAAERENSRDVDGEDSAGRSVPPGRRERRTQSRARVLRNAHDLETPLPARRGRSGVRVGV